MSVDEDEQIDSACEARSDLSSIEGGFGALGPLPRLSHRQVRLESRLARLSAGHGLADAVSWLREPLGSAVEVAPPEILWRPTGLRRVGLVAQLNWSRFATRIGLGIETPMAHGLVDRLLGFDRLVMEDRLPLSPVEWGVWTFVIAETLDRLAASGPGPLGPWEFTIDRVGPDPFDVDGLGRVVTLRWPVRFGLTDGSVRLWLPESLVARWLHANLDSTQNAPPESARAFAGLSATWRAEAGTIALPRGLKTLRVGGVLPITGPCVRGTPLSPQGSLDLTVNLANRLGRYRLPAEVVPNSGGARLTLTAPFRHEPTPREAIPVTPNSSPSVPNSASSTTTTPGVDVPLTLVVELGRVNLSVAQLADLKPGDVVELGRHAREPIELTSGGRLVARGELVQIDTELGVRVTNVFF